MRIAVIRSDNVCGSSFGLGVVASHWDQIKHRHCSIRVLLLWWQVVVVFRAMEY